MNRVATYRWRIQCDRWWKYSIDLVSLIPIGRSVFRVLLFLFVFIDWFFLFDGFHFQAAHARRHLLKKDSHYFVFFFIIATLFSWFFFSSSFGHFHFGSLSLSISGQVDAIYKKINKFLITCYSDFLLWIRYFLFFLPSFRHLFVASGFDSLRYWLVLLPVT